MAETSKDEAAKDKTTTKAPEQHTVSSASPQNRRTVTVTVPAFTLPKLPKVTLPQSRRWRNAIMAAAFIVVAILGGMGGGWLESRNDSTGLLTDNLSSQKQIVTSQGQLVSQIAKTVGQSVVSINDDISSSSGSSSDPSGSSLNPFGITQQPQEEQAAGTGIIISSSGYILTNRHVVPQGTTNVSVTLSDGTELKNVSVVGRTSQSSSLDVAILKINNAQGHKLVPAVLGDSSQVEVGDQVVAIGNALGQYQNTVTSGIISGYGRSVQASADTSGDGLDSLGSSSSSDSENLDDLFQTDAAINEGNSGGPLVNLNGQVIGINTAIASDAQNIGFSIPINDVKGIINQVFKTGQFAVPYLGVRYIPLTPAVASQYKLKVSNGAFVAPSSITSQPAVVSGSPAASAGLKANDIITQVDGINIDQTNSLASVLDQYTPGTTIHLTILRNGKTIHVSVKLGSQPSS